MNKILFVVPSFSGGGAERVVSVLSSELADMGHDISVIIYHKAENEYCYSSKINVINLSEGNIDAYIAMSFKTKILKLRRLIDLIKPNYIVPFLPQVGFHVFCATIGRSYKIIQTVRNNPKTDPETPMMRRIRNLMLVLSWRNFVQNKMQLDYFPNIIKKKTVILPNPVSNELFNKKHEYKGVRNIAAMGRLTEQKNFKMYIDAASIVHKEMPNMRFIIYGEGKLKEELMQYIDKNGLNEIVLIPGRTENPYDAVNKADVFVLSSNYEGMPNALMEAMALGVPSISTDCPTGPSDIICNGINGYLIPTDDAKKLANVIKKCALESNDLEHIGKEASRTISNKFGARVISNKFLKEVLLILQ